MRQYMPGDHDWVDKGPKVLNTLEVETESLSLTWPPEDKVILEIWRQGRDNPRMLTLEEERVAERNRETYFGDCEAIETWYETQVRTKVRKKR